MSRSIMILVALALLGGATTGCAILAPGEGHGGGTASLDDAIAAARRDSSTKVRRMDVGEETPPEVSAAIDLAPSEPVTTGLTPVTEPQVRTPREKPRLFFGVVAGAGFLGGSDYDGFDTFGITGGNFESARLRWDLTASASTINFKGESKLGQAFRDAVDLEIDLTARYYLTEPHTFMGFYPMVGLGTGTLFWDYAQRLPVVQDGESTTVGDDRINHFDFYGGAGMSLVQLRHLHVGGKLLGGVRFYGLHTYQGFDNDALPTTGFGRFLVEANYRH